MRKIIFSDKKLWRVLGKKQQNKKRIENVMNVVLEIKGEEITIKSKKKDSVAEYLTSEILGALSTGFDFDSAIKLRDENYVFKEINLKNRVKASRLETVKARIIGTKGKTKKVIEGLTGCSIVLADSTVSIIGTLDNVEVADKAIESLIRGSPHSVVYNYLEKSKAKLKELEIENIEDFIEK